MAESTAERTVLYQPDERPPTTLTVGLGCQYALLSLSGMIMIPLLIFRAAEAPEALLTWAVFASIVICGLITAVHAFPLWRIGAGYVLITGTTGTAIAVSVDAISEGGIALLASLVLVASLFQFALSFRLSLLRRVLTPAVTGTVLMLIPVTVMPVVFGRLDDLPEGSTTMPSLVSALITLVGVGGVMVKGTPRLRPWAPLIGLVLGSSASAWFGLYDVQRVVDAGWIGVPTETPDFTFDFGGAFLRLLPAFLLVFLVCSVRTTSGSIGIQNVSWRTRRAVDFRPVQGAVAADAVSNLFAGLAGTVPNGVRATTIALTEFSGVAARPVGIVFGLALAALAFFPKVLALVLAVPGPVIAGYIVVVITTIFALGMKMIVADGLDTRKSLVVGLSFWIGVGCQYGFIFPELIPNLAGGLLNSGLTTGALMAIMLTGLFELTAPRRRRLQTELEINALPAISAFVDDFSTRNNWNQATSERLAAAAEETLLTLCRDPEQTNADHRRLMVVSYRDGGDAVLEFIAAGGDENIEDRLALLGEGATGDQVEREVSLRLLRHLASDVHHRQYHDADYITVRMLAESP